MLLSSLQCPGQPYNRKLYTLASAVLELKNSRFCLFKVSPLLALAITTTTPSTINGSCPREWSRHTFTYYSS